MGADRDHMDVAEVVVSSLISPEASIFSVMSAVESVTVELISVGSLSLVVSFSTRGSGGGGGGGVSCTFLGVFRRLWLGEVPILLLLLLLSFFSVFLRELPPHLGLLDFGEEDLELGAALSTVLVLLRGLALFFMAAELETSVVLVRLK